MLLLEDLTIPADDRRWLEGVDLVVRRGERYGLVVSDRVVRAAIVALLAGHTAPERGRVRVDGLDPVVDADLLRGRVHVVSDDAPGHLPWLHADVLVLAPSSGAPQHLDEALVRPAEDGPRTPVTVLLVTDTPSLAARYCHRFAHLV